MNKTDIDPALMELIIWGVGGKDRNNVNTINSIVSTATKQKYSSPLNCTGPVMRGFFSPISTVGPLYPRVSYPKFNQPRIKTSIFIFPTCVPQLRVNSTVFQPLLLNPRMQRADCSSVLGKSKVILRCSTAHSSAPLSPCVVQSAVWSAAAIHPLHLICSSILQHFEWRSKAQLPPYFSVLMPPA